MDKSNKHTEGIVDDSELTNLERPSYIIREELFETGVTQSVTYTKIGYLRGLREVNNVTGKGRLIDYAIERLAQKNTSDSDIPDLDPRISEADEDDIEAQEEFKRSIKDRVAILPKAVYSGIYEIPGASVHDLRNLVALILPANKTEEIRRSQIPPTVPLGLSSLEQGLHMKEPETIHQDHEVTRIIMRDARAALSEIDLSLQDRYIISKNPDSAQVRSLYCREYIKHLYAGLHGVAREELILFPGAEEALRLIPDVLSILDKPGNLKIASQAREYSNFLISAKSQGHQLYQMWVDYDDPRKSYIPVEADSLYISIPNNPGGYTMTPEKVRDFLSILPAGMNVILDLVGVDAVNDKRRFVAEVLEISKEFTEWLIVVIVDSESKFLQLGSERLGFVMSNTGMFTGLFRRDFEANWSNARTAASYRTAIARAKSQNYFAELQDYMRNFYQVAEEIIGDFEGEVRWTGTVNQQAPSVKPAGYFCSMDFATVAARDRWLKYLNILTFDEYSEEGEDGKDVPLIRYCDMPYTGTLEQEQLDRLRYEKFVPVATSTKGHIQNMPTTSVRLCALGKLHQINAFYFEKNAKDSTDANPDSAAETLTMDVDLVAESIQPRETDYEQINTQKLGTVIDDDDTTEPPTFPSD